MHGLLKVVMLVYLIVIVFRQFSLEKQNVKCEERPDPLVGLLCEELRDARPGVDVELLRQLEEILHGDALVRHLFHI